MRLSYSSCLFLPKLILCATAAVVVAVLVVMPTGTNASAASSTSSSTTLEVKPKLSRTSNTHSFFILRHGETDANAADLEQGSSDFSRLTSRGKQQAQEVAQALEAFLKKEQLEIDSVYISPLTRARETLQILKSTKTNDLFLPDEFTVLNNLREIDLHEWEGHHKDDLQENYPESYKAWKDGDPHNFVLSEERRPLLDLWSRADAVWNEIKELERMRIKNNNVDSTLQQKQQQQHCSLLVCHGSLGQALLGTAMGWDATHFQKYKFPNCGLMEIEWDIDLDKATRWRWAWPEPSKWNYYNNKQK